ncbi:lebercilin [Cololabis saira]|uniref:lebercilin n=1 Tax=Cololabis saira TaxID=129043 RepID=UPI002AD2CE36|nr:lebercilin [Cololabis saira]
MESENTTESYKDNRDLSRQSHRTVKKDSPASSVQRHKKNIRGKINSEDEKESCSESRSRTRTWRSDPDKDQISDGDGKRSDGSFYSEDYENDTPSERSLSPFSQSRTPSSSMRREMRAKQISRNPLYKTGRWGVSRPQRPGGFPLTLQHRRGVRSQSKESTPPKDLDLVTKRMLSARLLKINELRNSLSELQHRTDELKKENRILRQLQVRQEKALQRYDDTESEISQLLSRHSSEMHVLHERVRRSQERERAAERRLKDSEEQLQRSQKTITRLKKLVDQRELGARDELNRRLEEEKTRAQEAERKVKELERNLELSNSSFQRQLVAEKKKTVGAQEDIKTLQEELERLTNKLKEKERELDVKNIYANRMIKASVKKDTESGTKQKALSRNIKKAVQTEDRTPSLDFPTPPPAISDAYEGSEPAPDEYLSLKEFHRVERQSDAGDLPPNCEEQKKRDKRRHEEKEVAKKQEHRHRLTQELNIAEEKEKRISNGLEKENNEEEERKSFLLDRKEDENYRKRGLVQEEVAKWNQESLSNQQAAEEARRKKEQLLAKMREIDNQNQGAQDSMFVEPSPPESSNGTRDYSPRPPDHRDPTSSIFNLTEAEEMDGLHAGRRRAGLESGAATGGKGRRVLRSQTSSDDLAFGGYAPSFGRPTSRASFGFPPPPGEEDRSSALEAIGVFSLKGVETEKNGDADKRDGKDRKLSLMQQLFGAQALLAGDGLSSASKMEVLDSPPPPSNGVHSRRKGLLSFSSGSSTPPASSVNTLHVADSRPAVRAIASFDDEIEELTL